MNDIYWKLITKKFGGESSSEEDKDIERLLLTDTSFKQAYSEAQAIWKTSASSYQKAPQKPLHVGERSLDDILSAIDSKVMTLEKSEGHISIHRIGNYSRRKWIISSVAASILFLVGIFYTTELEKLTNKIHTTITSYSNPKGTKIKSVDLPDGSKALLLGGTQLELIQFDEDANQRKVNLIGEAVFNVVSNPEKPFVVTTPNTSIQVLGTVFSIQAYKDAAREVLTVREGKVSYVAGTKNRLVKANQSISYLSNEQKFTEVENVALPDNPNEYLVFNDIELGTAKVILENHFNKKIILAEQELSERKIYGKFKKENLSEILQAISLALDLQYEIKEKEIRLKSR